MLGVTGREYCQRVKGKIRVRTWTRRGDRLMSADRSSLRRKKNGHA